MRRFITLWFTTIFIVSFSYAQPVLEFVPMTLSGPALSQPVDITGCGDNSGRLFVVEKRGTIRIVQNGVVLTDFFLDIQTQVMNSGERGLLGLAFHPQYPDSPYIYVNYVPINTIITRISRFTLNPNNSNDILENSQLILLTQPGIQTNHKAGDLAFGPDGYLYFGLGDGGGGGDPDNNGQDLEIWLAKILRIDINSKTPPLNYSIPPSNPFVGVPGLDEIWAYGIRNPWRISFDRETGDLWIADVGQNLWEEIDMIPAGTPGGMNFGWDCREGTHNYEPANCGPNTTFTAPIFEYPHSCNPCPNGQGASITGGFVYRGALYPNMAGYYICADYISDNIWMIQQTGFNPPTFDVIVQNGSGMINDVVTFGENDNGELFAGSLTGVLYRVTETTGLAVSWEAIDVLRINQGNKVLWTMHDLTGIDRFEVERSLTADFAQFTTAGQVSPVPDQIYYSFIDPYYQHLGIYYRICAVTLDGEREYSPIKRLIPDPVAKPSLVYDVGQGLWRVSLPDQWQTGEVILYDLQGKEVFTKKLSRDKMVELGPPIIPGCYFIQIKSGSDVWSDRVVL